MNKVSPFHIAILASVLLAWQAPAYAQTPQQIQGMIASGQESAALSDLNTILQAHPTSGVAWYLTAEAQDAAGKENAARTALANADQYAPGLPFAKPSEAAALRAHLANPAAAPQPVHRGVSPVALIIGGLILLFIVMRMFNRRRRFNPPMPYQGGYNQGVPPYGPGGGPGFGGGMMGGGGIGSSILGGLAAGAGFAAGERVIDDMMGGNRNQGIDQNQNWDNNSPMPDASRDDGLNGNPGWDDNSGQDDSNFDPNNSW